jgi:hypothetical protein
MTIKVVTVALWVLALGPLASAGVWTLEYRCDYNPACIEEADAWTAAHPADYQTRSFRRKQQAIDWIEQNYQYTPVMLWHNGKAIACDKTYLDADDPDPITRDRKAVTCDDKGRAGKP